MNKIITILLVFILSGCSTQQIKTSDISSQTSEAIASTTPQKTRHHSTLHFGVNKPGDEDESLLPRITRYLKQGIASWYGPGFHGKKTASGEIYDMYAMTAAHNTLPIPSYARVTNLENQRSVIVRINDRGPFHGDRVMDLSYAAAKKLDLAQSGTGTVEIKAIAPEQALTQQQDNTGKHDKNVYLNVGTFNNKKKALNLQNKISASHLPHPKILPSKHKGSTLYKVQMGPIKSAENVHKLNLQLAKLGITATQFITEADQKQMTVIQ
jgi:rare lipoprotein A